eukprot:TRINITY_DN9574_c0_g1_i1.p1 TRINITY_DN9574_c0_g1~~TRINITY_DN9574_c0_g1_i1.p1  ORF type:complete len:1028 (-),score=229.28 TRINITY_DN9574_c0_g1_i1:61-3144(-)
MESKKIAYIAIYPPIQLCRVGNSEEWFLGPEKPYRYEVPEDGKFKDKEGKLKRQGVRFRIYGFDMHDNPICEITNENAKNIKWDVSVANKKSAWYSFPGIYNLPVESMQKRNPTIDGDKDPEQRHALIIGPINKSVNTEEHKNHKKEELKGNIKFNLDHPIEVKLGEILLDPQGRLIFVGGYGKADTAGNQTPVLTQDFDTPYWYDDTCDGTVNATVQLKDGQILSTTESGSGDASKQAWVLVGPPKYAPDVLQPTTLWDTIWEVAVRMKWVDDSRVNNPDKPVSWKNDVWPILERATQTAWVNNDAWDGHAPGKPGNFKDPRIRNKLKSPKEQDATYRKNVFWRLRVPEPLPIKDSPGFDELKVKYEQQRKGQAYPYFMPRIAGNNDRNTSGDPQTWASLTATQYTIMEKWMNGNFIDDDDDIASPTVSLENELFDYVKGPLLYGIGNPLFPGIEMSYPAWLPETYYFKKHQFPVKKQTALRYIGRFASGTKPGDITKYLSNPWQSDFFMCRVHWWPGTRPDDVVPESEYNRIFKIAEERQKQIVPQKDIKTRLPWERGLRPDYRDLYQTQPLWGNQDMVYHFGELGIIVNKKENVAGNGDFFVEVERNFKYRSLPYANPINNVQRLKEHLQNALSVELSTIPMYLYAMYTINVGDDQEFYGAYFGLQMLPNPKPLTDEQVKYGEKMISLIKNVASQEMLHLCLVGNVLKALGGEPLLYCDKVVPKYPGNFPHADTLTVHLDKLCPEQVDLFIEVEEPAPSNGVPQADNFSTIAQFYDAVENAIVALSKEDKHIWKPELSKYQFHPGQAYAPRVQDTGNITVVVDDKTALEALKIITDQGEGLKGEYTVNRWDDESKLELSHYATFKQLKEMLKSPNCVIFPSVADPRRNDIKDRRIVALLDLFNAAYSYLLVVLQTIWQTSDEKKRGQLIYTGMMTIMIGIMRPLAQTLVRTPHPSGQGNMGPSFEFYKFVDDSTFKTQISNLLEQCIELWSGAGDVLQRLSPVNLAVKTLLDLGKPKDVLPKSK